jgi:hypothetical protein
METGSTATEILMCIRWQLREIDAGRRTLDLTTKRRIHELVAELDKILA